MRGRRLLASGGGLAGGGTGGGSKSGGSWPTDFGMRWGRGGVERWVGGDARGGGPTDLCMAWMRMGDSWGSMPSTRVLTHGSSAYETQIFRPWKTPESMWRLIWSRENAASWGG